MFAINTILENHSPQSLYLYATPILFHTELSFNWENLTPLLKEWQPKSTSSGTHKAHGYFHAFEWLSEIKATRKLVPLGSEGPVKRHKRSMKTH